jgi:hypothetical protein
MTSQPPLEDLRNALTIAEFWGMGMSGWTFTESQSAFQDTARLIRAALEKLAEPNTDAVNAGRILISCLPAYGFLEAPNVTEREARDIAAAILKVQLEGGLR